MNLDKSVPSMSDRTELTYPGGGRYFKYRPPRTVFGTPTTPGVTAKSQPTNARVRAVAPPRSGCLQLRNELAVLNMLTLPSGREKRSLRCTPCACHQRHERVWATPCRATAGQCCSATPFLFSLLRLGQLAIAPSTLWLWALPCRRRPRVITL